VFVKAHECFHCKQWIPEGVEHDCWTTTEYALTKDLSEDLRDAWERLREMAVEFGEQRIYASHHSIMFSRKSCYFFVRPQRHRLELVFFLGRPLKAPTGAQDRQVLQDQVGAHRPCGASRSGRSADHELAEGGLRGSRRSGTAPSRRTSGREEKGDASKEDHEGEGPTHTPELGLTRRDLT
jgi:hypothetical protein